MRDLLKLSAAVLLLGPAAGFVVLVVVAVGVLSFGQTPVEAEPTTPEPIVETITLFADGWTPSPWIIKRVCHDRCVEFCAAHLGFCRSSGGTVDPSGNIRCAYRCSIVL